MEIFGMLVLGLLFDRKKRYGQPNAGDDQNKDDNLDFHIG
jgi:hypothetical protein